MPNPSHNSSSLPKPHENGRRIYTAPNSVEDSTAKPQQTSPEADSNDWFYGTEELLDALPRVWTRSLLYLLIGFTAIALPWTMLSKVDETGSARGRIEPKGATQKLDSPALGSVTAVKVKEGDSVKAGQVLVELESDVLRTTLQEAQKKLEGQQNRLAQLELLKNQLLLAIRVQEQQNQAQELEKIAQVNQAQQNLDAKKTTYNLQKLEKQAEVDQVRHSLTSTQTAYKLANSRLNRDLTEVERYRQLWQSGAVPQIKIVELEKVADESQTLQVQAQSDVKQAQLRLQEEQSRYETIITQAEADIKQAQLRLQEQQSSYQSLVNAGKLAVLKTQEQLKALQTEVTSLRSEIDQTKTQIKSIAIQLQQRMVRSPIDGTIYQLPIAKPGSVVQPGQMIAQIAPNKTSLVLKAEMPSQQSGFLKVGMPVKIKFDAYPFQDYGVVQGRVSWIAPDSKIQTTNFGNTETFELEIALSQPYIQSGNKRIPLTPGQTATAEVIVRQRRVSDFILDPFKKLQKGGLEL